LRRILIFGNSGSGKSTLAKKITASHGLAHLDLDTLAWQPKVPPQRKSLETSKVDILAFVRANSGWVIEGCYADLLELALPFSSEIVFLNLSVEDCIKNARSRAWEPHKYQSKQAQDDNLDMLLHWISQYSVRDDEFSQAAHNKIYAQFAGKKSMLLRNQE